MLEDEAFAAPLHWGAARRSAYDALVLPGGHRARGMRPYLESPEVQQMAIDAFRAEKPVGAICHGVLVAARAVDPVTERSVLYGRRTTALDLGAGRQGMGHRPLTRGSGTATTTGPTWRSRGSAGGTCRCSRRSRGRWPIPADFADVEKGSPDWRRKASGRARDTLTDERPAFVVRDGSYVSARWPGDAHTFARTFAAVLAERA